MTPTASPPPIPPPPALPSIAARDFPGWLPPMLVKELRQGLRTRGFIGTLVGFQMVMLVLTLVALSAQGETASNARAAGATITSGIFWTILSVQLIFVTPSRALGGLQIETDSRKLDLLVLTRLNAWRIVLGKWISLLVQAALLLVAMLPYLVVRYFTDNADLVAEFGRCLLMLGFCGVLTAAGLWGSGFAKMMRVVIAILMGILFVQLLGAIGLMGGSGGARPFFARLFELPFDIFNGAFITAFFLVSAVRNIAPVAENHALFTRMLPVLMLLPAPIAEALGAHGLAVRQVFISAVFLGFVLMFEFAAGRAPMPSHWRAWHGGGRLSRAIGRLALPGWPSVLLFGGFAAAVWAAIALYVLPSSAATRDHAVIAVWLALLAFSGIVFPAVLQSFVRVKAAPPALLYFCGLGLPAALAGLSLWLAESRWNITVLKSIMETMPFSSFLFGLNTRNQSPAIVTAQGIVAVVVLGAAYWQSRGYWRRLAEFDARDRAVAEASRPQSS